MQEAEKLRRGLIKLQGPDNFKFLQGLVTNDMRLADKGLYCFLLNSGGKYLFDFFVLEVESNYIIDVALSQKDELLAKLHLYKMRCQVIISDLSEEYMVTYSKHPFNEAIFSYQDPRYSKLGFRSLFLKDSMKCNIENLYIADKYNYAITDGDIDMSKEKSFPIEYGAEQLNAISYTKGCYVGQEVVSRTKYQGVIRKSVMKIEFSYPYIASTDRDIFQNQKKIGHICSSYGVKAIALIRNEEYQQDLKAAPLTFGNYNIISLVKAPWY